MRGALDALHRHRGDLAVALDEPLGRAALELDVDKLRGDLGRCVEAQRVGADEIGLAFLEFLLVESRSAPRRGFRPRRRRTIRAPARSWSSCRHRSKPRARANRRSRTPYRRGRASRAPRGTGARSSSLSRPEHGRRRRLEIKSGSSRLSDGRPKRIVDCGTSRSIRSIAPRPAKAASGMGLRSLFAGRSANALSTSAAASFSSIAPTTAISNWSRAIPRLAALTRSARSMRASVSRVPLAAWP